MDMSESALKTTRSPARLAELCFSASASPIGSGRSTAATPLSQPPWRSAHTPWRSAHTACPSALLASVVRPSQLTVQTQPLTLRLGWVWFLGCLIDPTAPFICSQISQCKQVWIFRGQCSSEVQLKEEIEFKSQNSENMDELWRIPKLVESQMWLGNNFLANASNINNGNSMRCWKC